MTNKKITIGLVIVAVIAIIGLFTPKSVFQKVGSITTNLPSMGLTDLAVGSGCDQGYTTCTGTDIQRINTGFCYIQAYATTIAATSTAQVDCQATAAVGKITTVNDTTLTGVSFGDKVLAMLSTTTASTVLGGIGVVGATASTTNGYITLIIANNTGTTYTWPTTGVATGTAQYIVTR